MFDAYRHSGTSGCAISRCVAACLSWHRSYQSALSPIAEDRGLPTRWRRSAFLGEGVCRGRHVSAIPSSRAKIKLKIQWYMCSQFYSDWRASFQHYPCESHGIHTASGTRWNGSHPVQRKHYRAPRSGRGGRRFKSCHSDHWFQQLRLATSSQNFLARQKRRQKRSSFRRAPVELLEPLRLRADCGALPKSAVRSFTVTSRSSAA